MTSTSSSPLQLPLFTPPTTTTHHNLTIPLPTLKTPTIRSRLSRLCQEGQPLLARQLFDTIPNPSTAIWNTIIIGFICNNMPFDALLFYSHMKKTASPHTKCDSYTYSSTLKACAETQSLSVGRAIHAHLIRCLAYPSRVVYNSLLNMYSACLSKVYCGVGGEFDFWKYDVVRRVFDTMRKRDVVAWNILVSWYVKTERHVKGIKQFRMMMRMGIKPSPVSFVNVFPAFSGIGDYRNANVVYGMLLKLGSEYTDDLFVVSSAISMFSELGYLDSAKMVFDCCYEKNAEVWNTMISEYVQNNCYSLAIDHFVQAMEMEDAIVDEVTYLLALAAVSQLQSLKLAEQMHALVVKKLKGLPLTILNASIAMYSRCSSVHLAFKFFEKMQERDTVSWNTMISAFVQNGLDCEGLMLVYEMQKQGFEIDSVTMAAVLSAASNLRNREVGKQSHAYLLRHGMKFDGMYSYLIDMYAKSGLIRNSQRIFQNSIHTGDLATWNAMIAGYAQNGLSEEAFMTLRQMLEHCIIPNEVTLASILPACSLSGSINLGKQLHGFLVRNFMDKNVFVSTALVDMYSKSGAIGYAERVFTNTTEKNSVTYTTLIVGYGQHGMGEKALSLFQSMQNSGLKPDSVTFVAVLSACSYTGLVDEGLQIFESMERDFDIQPSTRHYCCVTDMLGRVGRINEADEFVQELGEEGNTLEILGSLLGACRLHGHVELGEIITQKLLEMNRLDCLGGYQVLLSNMYAEEGDWKNVDKVRKEMREKGMQKETGYSWIDVGGLVNQFVSKDQDHPLSDEIYEMLRVLTTEMINTDHSLSLST